MSKEPKKLPNEDIVAAFQYAVANQLTVAVNDASFESGGIVQAEANKGEYIVHRKEAVLPPDFTSATIGMDFTKQKGIQALDDLRDSLSFQSKPPFQILLA